MKSNENKSGFNQMIELTEKSDQIINDNKIVNHKKIRKENLDNQEDEDILKQFQIKNKNKKNNKTGNFKREAAFSTVRHQLQDKFSLDNLGKIKWAKEHASANRPMNKIKEFNKSTKFCNCCNLPCETPGIIQPFSFCENVENFSICGRAVPLYFYFIKYCIYCLIIILIVMSIPISYINYGITSEIKSFCINIRNSENIIYEKINSYLILNIYDNL